MRYYAVDGNVYRSTGDEWQMHSAGGGWETWPAAARARRWKFDVKNRPEG
jgi:hypothetical protein